LRVTRKPDIAWRRYRSTAPSRSRDSPYPFAYGRTALEYGVRAIGLSRGDVVLCPDFVCHTVVESLRRAQLEVRFHPVTEALTPDWSVLDAVPAESAAALVMVHYFGAPQDVDRYRTLCDGRGWRLLEDNAHGHGAIVDGRLLGTFGDLGISSPYKSFPIRNGGLLYLPSGTAFDPPHLPCAPLGLPVRMARSALRRLQDLHLGLRGLLRKCPPYSSQAAFRDEVVLDWAMDTWSFQHLAGADLPALRHRRQALYRVWQEWSGRYGLSAVFPHLAPGAMPLVYPASTGSPAASVAWFRWGHRNGIDVHSWPTLPLSVVTENGPAVRRWERTVCFPIHQSLTPADLESHLRRLRPPPLH
jgi:DegT/DnrJ/EryC1/StrS aminotransferase family protein